MVPEKKNILIGAAVVVVVIVAAVLLTWSHRSEIGTNPAVWQAVLLDNNQIYFGHLQRLNDSFSHLTDVYYVQLGTPAPGQTTPSNKLVRLGDTESHGPENEMTVNKDHIIFWENLRANAPVVQAILNLKLQMR